MNKDELGSGELRKIKSFLEYTIKQLDKAKQSASPDINLVHKLESNIKLYEKQIRDLEK